MDTDLWIAIEVALPFNFTTVLAQNKSEIFHAFYDAGRGVWYRAPAPITSGDEKTNTTQWFERALNCLERIANPGLKPCAVERWKPLQAPADKAAIGILLVHGIGVHSDGQTLVAMGEPLMEWIKNWLSEINTPWLSTRKTDMDFERERQTRKFGGGYTIVDDAVCVSNSSEPAHAAFNIRLSSYIDGRVKLTSTGDLAPSEKPEEFNETWLIAESLWDASFPPPDFAQVLKWSTIVAPFVVGSTILDFFNSACNKLLNVLAGRSQLRRLFGLPLRLLCVLLAFLLGLGTTPLILTLEAVLLALAFVSRVPIPALREYVRWAQYQIAAIIGDSYIFIASPIRRSVIINKVQRDLEWLASRCENVILLAHSQGAAVTYYTFLQKQIPSNLRLLVTFGSGLKKLAKLGSDNGSTLADRLVLAGWISLFPLGLVCAAAIIGLMPISPIAITLAAITGMIFFGTFTSFIKLDIGRDFFKHSMFTLKLKNSSIHWVDLYASADPVPSGPLMDRPNIDKLPEMEEVCNHNSIISDHTTYWGAKDDFVAAVVRAIACHGGTRLPLAHLTPWDQHTLEVGKRTRRSRIKFLNSRALLLSVALLALTVNEDVLLLAGSVAEEWFLAGTSALSRATGTGITNLVPDWVPTAAKGLLAILAYWMLSRLILGAAWKSANRHAESLFFRRIVRSACFFGLPYVADYSKRWIAWFKDFAIRLVPALFVALALALYLNSVPRIGFAQFLTFEGKVLFWVGIAAIIALADLILSYKESLTAYLDVQSDNPSA